MPPATKEPTPGPGEAPAAAPAPDSAPPSSGGFKSWLPLIVTLLVMPVLAYAMTTFVLIPRIQNGIGLPGSTASASGEHGTAAGGAKKSTVAINKLLVNVAGTMGARYLLVSLSVAGSDPELAAKLQEMDPQLRDMACSTLRSKTLADLEKPGACNLIRSELLTGFNSILGGPVVQDIYFTEFAIQ